MKLLKRGVSPLIATVLLIAVAVALGAVIMTYSGNIGKCNDISIEVGMANSKPKVCYDVAKKMIELTIENGADSDVNYFKVMQQGSRNNANIEVEQLIGKSEIKNIEIPYDINTLGRIEKIKIVPEFKEGENIELCPVNKAIVIEGIPDCK